MSVTTDMFVVHNICFKIYSLSTTIQVCLKTHLWIFIQATWRSWQRLDIRHLQQVTVTVRTRLQIMLMSFHKLHSPLQHASYTWIQSCSNHWSHSQLSSSSSRSYTRYNMQKTAYNIVHSTIWSPATALLHDELHWLDIPQRVQYKLAMTVHQCLRNQAPTYLTDYCVPVSDVAGRRHLWSASHYQLTVPHVRCSTFGCPSWLVLQSGIHCLTICTIQLLCQTSFNGLWKPTCLPVVSVSLGNHLRQTKL